MIFVLQRLLCGHHSVETTRVPFKEGADLKWPGGGELPHEVGNALMDFVIIFIMIILDIYIIVNIFLVSTIANIVLTTFPTHQSTIVLNHTPIHDHNDIASINMIITYLAREYIYLRDEYILHLKLIVLLTCVDLCDVIGWGTDGGGDVLPKSSRWVSWYIVCSHVAWHDMVTTIHFMSYHIMT